MQDKTMKDKMAEEARVRVLMGHIKKAKQNKTEEYFDMIERQRVS